MNRCKQCGKLLPLRERLRKGRHREYCNAACKMRAVRARNKVRYEVKRFTSGTVEEA